MSFYKVLPNFTITYWHDIFACEKCSKSVTAEELGTLFPLYKTLKCPNQSSKIDELFPDKKFSKANAQHKVWLHLSQNNPGESSGPSSSSSTPHFKGTSVTDGLHSNSCESETLKHHLKKCKNANVQTSVAKKVSAKYSHCFNDPKSLTNLLQTKSKGKPHLEIITPSKSINEHKKLPHNAAKNQILDAKKINKLPSLCMKKGELECKMKKTPGKGTLKRRRWYIDKLKQCNENYEDDIFEDRSFSDFQEIFEDESNSSGAYDNMCTPKMDIVWSPKGDRSPAFEDCYNPTELNIIRKEAEEYLFRRGKRRKTVCLKGREHSKKEKLDVDKTLNEVARILTQQKMKAVTSDIEGNGCDDDDLSSNEEEICANYV